MNTHYEQLMSQECKDNLVLRECIDAISAVTKGEVFLFGSAVYGALVKRLYGKDVLAKDVDFIIESKVMGAPQGWSLHLDDCDAKYHLPINSYKKGDLRIDVALIGNYGGNIVDCTETTPLNVQGIVCNVRTGQVFGNPGCFALQHKIVRVQSLEKATAYASARKLSVEELVRRKAELLGFSY